MKLFYSALIATFLALTSPVSYSHGENEMVRPLVSAGEVEIRAKSIVKRKADMNEIEASWSSVNANSVEQKTQKGSSFWMVTFLNDSVADPSKQALFVKLSLDGRYLSANHTED